MYVDAKHISLRATESNETSVHGGSPRCYCTYIFILFIIVLGWSNLVKSLEAIERREIIMRFCCGKSIL